MCYFNFSYTQVLCFLFFRKILIFFSELFSPFVFFFFRKVLTSFTCFFSKSLFVFLTIFVCHFLYIEKTAKNILYLTLFIKIFFIRIFFIRIFFIRVLFIRIRGNFYAVSNILRHLFFFNMIFTFFYKHLWIIFLPVIKAELIKITDKQIN